MYCFFLSSFCISLYPSAVFIIYSPRFNLNNRDAFVWMKNEAGELVQVAVNILPETPGGQMAALGQSYDVGAGGQPRHR